MENIEKEILAFPLRILKYTGQNPEQSKATIFIVVALNTFVGITLIVLNCIQLIYADGNIVTISQNCEGIAGVIQVIGKILITAIKIKGFRKMIKSAAQFWSIRTSMGNSQIYLNTFRRIIKLTRLFFNSFILSMIAVILTACLTKQLPFGAWTLKDHQTLYTSTLILQAYFVFWSAIFAGGYDTLFLSFCIHLRTQFKMLNDSFEDLKVSALFSKPEENIFFKKLSSYVQHHDFLLRFSNDLRDTYSPVMLVIYISLLMIYFANMYVILESKSVSLSARNIFVLVTLLLQLAFYCIPLNYVTDEAISVSQGIYNSDWHSKHYPSLKSVVPLIIQRSQRQIKFNAGGLIEMNCTTLISVVRLSYSLCTIMRRLKNN